MRALCVTGWMMIAASGCSQPPPEPVGRSGAGTTAGLKEYTHTLSRSRFAIGPSVAQYSEFGIDKAVGDWGVFGTNAKTGMVLALPNADAPPRARAALKGGPEVHNDAVRAYFIAAGLPADELGIVAVNTKMSAGGSGVDGPSQWEFESYTSRIGRQHDGVPVADSFAWAQINDLGEVVTESVYWPHIPEGVLVAAAAFKKKLADPALRQAFLAKAPDGGSLVIHHTPGTWEGSFQAAVSYDVGSFGQTLHYDAGGAKVALPTEH